MDLVAIVEQLYLFEGEARETAAPGLLFGPAPPRSARGRERDQLFVHLTLAGQGEESLSQAAEFARLVRQTFFHTEGSATAALRRAVLDLNEQLLHLNLSSKSSAYEGAITCAALRGDELFTVQVGEALAFLGHNFGVERLTTTKPGTPSPTNKASAPTAATTPLGRTAGIDIRFAYHRLQPGDMLLLAEPRLAHLSGSTLSDALVDTDILTGVENLATIVAPFIGQDAARLLLVEFSDESPTYLSVVSRSRRNPLATMAANLAEEKAAPTRAVPRRPMPAPIRESAAAPAQPADEAATFAAEDISTAARRVASQSARGLSAFTGWLADFLNRLRTPASTEGETTTNMALPLLLSVFIPLLLAVVVTGAYLRNGRVQQIAEIKQAMAQSLTLATEAGDDAAAARDHYNTVLVLASEAETMRPGDGEVRRMLLEAREQLDRLDGITRLSAELLYTYDSTAQMEAVVLREGTEGGIFTLDRANNNVYIHQTEEDYLELTAQTPQTVVFNGQSVGNQVVGPVTDMLWRPQGAFASRDGLMMLDRTGVVFTYYPNFDDLRALPLGFSSFWREPIAITDYSERLYVLDRGAGQIWKYFPQGEGFVLNEDDQTIFFGPEADLGAAVDFDIYSGDGSLLVVYEDGRARYYDTRSGRIQWDENTLLNNGLTSPLVAPTAVKLVGRGLNASAFIADPGSSRIIQVSRGGTVLAQYRTADETGQELFAQMTEFDVAETPLRIFVVAGNKLYVVRQQ